MRCYGEYILAHSSCFTSWSWNNNIINEHILFILISKKTLKACWEIIFHALGLKQVLFINRACVNHRQSWQISWISHGENIRFHGLKQINRKIILESRLSKFCMLWKNEMKNSDSSGVHSLIYTCIESHMEHKSSSSNKCLVKPLKSIFSYIRQDTLEPEHQELQRL